MILILEGCDASGKSTLKSVIKPRYNFVENVPHGLPTDKTALTMCIENANAINLANFSGENVLLDRGWMSEEIYSPILRRRPSRFAEWQTRMLERMAMTTGAIVVLCDPGWDTVKGNWQKRGDAHIRDPGTLHNIYDDYHDIDLMTSLPIVVYDYNDHNGHDNIAILMEQVFDRAAGYPGISGVFGNAYADTLVVVSESPKGGAPMISWSQDSLPAKITRAFMRAHVSERELAWTCHKGHELRKILEVGRYSTVAYIGNSLGLDVQAQCAGLDSNPVFIPLPDREVSFEKFLP